MLGNHGRGFTRAVFGPVARRFVAWGIAPDAVTVAGTVLVMAAALILFPTGHLAIGALTIGVLALTDSIDGQMARHLGHSSRFGAFLDSTMDRFADAAIFVGLVLYFVGLPEEAWRMTGLVAALACLVLGGLVSYARAKAEGLGMTAKVGIAERADRLIVTLVATLAVGLGAPTAVLAIALILLALASLFTVGQRIASVHHQSTTEPAEQR